MNLETIKLLIKNRQYDDALTTCNELTESHPEFEYEIMYQRSHVYAARGNYKDAVKELSLIIDAGKATLGNYDTAAFWALFDEQLEQSLDWYLIALKMGEDQDESWFRSNELFLISYIYFKLEEFEKAISFLNKLEVENTNSSFLIPIPNEGIVAECTAKQLLEEIYKSKNVA
jgi:hypothetical protein